jgi:hypothetical protein
MTYTEIVSMLESIGLPLAYHHFEEGESPDPPFLIFYFAGTDNFGADDKVYQKVQILDIELYTDAKDPALEEQIESVLDGHEMYYDKDESWIASEKMYEVIYEMEIIYHGEQD